jgi:muconolactone delta-isomerase
MEEASPMEYFVEMTTHVPQGTPDGAVDDIRAREAVRAHELAAEGHLLRLWRPPLAPGEWRAFGLFGADDECQFGEMLASMALHVWRTDRVAPLWEHRIDPASAQERASMDYLTTLTPTVPEGAASAVVADMKAREAIRAHDQAGLKATLESLPLYAWMTVETTPLSTHPNDPERDSK